MAPRTLMKESTAFLFEQAKLVKQPCAEYLSHWMSGVANAFTRLGKYDFVAS